MDAKEAVQRAFAHFQDIFEGEELTNIGLEEVIFDEDADVWKVTIGFSRPWDYTEPGLITALQPRHPTREYKLVTIDNRTGEMKSITIREVQRA